MQKCTIRHHKWRIHHAKITQTGFWSPSVSHSHNSDRSYRRGSQRGVVAAHVQTAGRAAGLCRAGAVVEFELGGYPAGVELPTYRMAATVSSGKFVGPFGSQVDNPQIPVEVLAEYLRESYRVARLGQPVSAYENLVRGGQGASRYPGPWRWRQSTDPRSLVICSVSRRGSICPGA